jgi:predicted component of type VI protein secretion system
VTKKLVLSDGTRERELHLVGRIVVGRDPACEISHDDSLLSRRHAEFVTSGNTVSVRDLGSRNGVFVNGARASEQTLQPGDIVQIGPLRARFVVDAAPRSMSPEAMDVDRTAVIRTAAPPPPVPAPVNAALAAAFEEVDEDATRLVPDSSASRSASESAPLFVRPDVAAEDDEDMTRFTAAPELPAPRPVLRKVDLPPRIGPPESRERAVPPESREAAVWPEPRAVRPPAIAPVPAGDVLGTFVFGQILMLALAILAATAVALVLSNRTLLAAGGSAPSLALAWFALPVAVAIAGTFVVGGAVNRRIASALAENDRART